jgi:outer membrane lipoprotein-sorting protein
MKDSVAFKNKMKDFSLGFQGFESSFKQIKTMQMLKEASVSEGVFCYRSDGSFRWEYISPFKYVMVVKDGKVRVRDESGSSTSNMASSKVYAEINGKIISLVNGTFLDDTKEFKHQLTENDQYYKVSLIPLNKRIQKYIALIEVRIDKRDMTATKLNLSAQNGDRTQFIFYNKRINQPISNEKFVIR